MKIKNKFLLGVVIPLGLTLMATGVFLAIKKQTRAASEKETTADQIMRQVAEQNLNIDHYLLRQEERPLKEFEILNRSLSQLVGTFKATDAEEKEIIDLIKQNLETIRVLFTNLSTNGGLTVSREDRESLIGQILVRTREIVATTARLIQKENQELEALQTMAEPLLMGLLLLLGIGTAASSFLVGRSISRSLRALQEGTRAIAGGNLDYRLDDGGRDEIKELSAAFNEMTKKLALSHVSINELQKEITERKRAEEALREAYGRLQTFFDHRIGGIGIVIGNARGDILQANDYYLSILGCTREELLSGLVDWRRMTPPEWLPADEHALDQLRQRGVCDLYEKEYMRRDGSRVPVLITDVMMPGESGDILAFVMDITERKKTETRLAADLAALTRTHALSGRLVEAGRLQPLLQGIMDAAVAIVGAGWGTLHLLEGDSLRIVAHRGHQNPFLEFFASAENRASVCGEAMLRGNRVVVPDVETSTLFAGTPSLAIFREEGVRAVQSTPMVSRTGTLLGILTTQWDVPYSPDEHDLWRIDLLARQAADLIEHARTGEALRESERRERERAAELATILDAVPAPVFIAHDPDCLHITGNRAADELLRNPHGREASLGAPAEVRPRHFKAFKDGRELRTDELPAQMAARGCKVRNFDFSLVFDDGTIRQVVGYGTPLQDDDGRPRGSVLVLVDITERKRAEEALQQRTLELQRLTQTLETRVEERTAELARLSHELLMAQENERRRISYDLHDHVWQTLLAIRSELENLFSPHRDGDWNALQSKSKQVMAAILDAVGKIRSMQGDLWPYVLDDIGILATIDWYCRDFEKGHAGVTLARQVEVAEKEIPGPVKIVIYRAMQETLDNAARHSGASRVMLRLVKTDHRIEFAVQDNGVGFDVEEAIARRTPWGGLGLLSIKGRTELSGGAFGVESARGQGTTVRASWPLSEKDA